MKEINRAGGEGEEGREREEEGEGGKGGGGGGRFLVPCMLPDVSPQRLPVLKNTTVLRRSYFLPPGHVLPIGVMGRMQV